MSATAHDQTNQSSWLLATLMSLLDFVLLYTIQWLSQEKILQVIEI